MHAPNNLDIVETMFATLTFAVVFLALSGLLLAHRPVRAKLLPLLRRAR